MVNNPFTRPYFLGGVALGGVPLDSNDNRCFLKGNLSVTSREAKGVSRNFTWSFTFFLSMKTFTWFRCFFFADSNHSFPATPRKFKMEAERKWFPKPEYPFPGADVAGSMFNFRGV